MAFFKQNSSQCCLRTLAWSGAFQASLSDAHRLGSALELKCVVNYSETKNPGQVACNALWIKGPTTTIANLPGCPGKIFWKFITGRLWLWTSRGSWRTQCEPTQTRLTNKPHTGLAGNWTQYLLVMRWQQQQLYWFTGWTSQSRNCVPCHFVEEDIYSRPSILKYFIQLNNTVIIK